MRRALVLALCAAGGCGSPTVADVIVTFQNIPTLAAIDKLKAQVTGGESDCNVYTITDQLTTSNQARFVYYATGADTIQITVSAYGMNDRPIGSGSAEHPLAAGRATTFEIVVDAAAMPPAGSAECTGADGGAGDDALDLAGQDLTGVDQAHAITPSACADLGVLFCDNFENRSFDGGLGPWMLGGSDAVDIDTTQAHSGSRAVHMTLGSSGYSKCSFYEMAFVPAPFYARVWVRFNKIPAASGTFALLALHDSSDGYLEVATNDTAHLKLDGNTVTSTPNSMVLAPDTWYCLEWMVDRSASGVSHLSLDDTPLTDPNLATVPNPAFVAFDLFTGDETFTVAPPVEVWYDDVIVDDKPIGCAK